MSDCHSVVTNPAGSPGENLRAGNVRAPYVGWMEPASHSDSTVSTSGIELHVSSTSRSSPSPGRIPSRRTVPEDAVTLILPAAAAILGLRYSLA